LQFQESGEGALGQPAGRSGGDLFEGEEVQVQKVRATIGEGPACDNSPPLGSEVADFLELLGSQSRSGHVSSILGFASSDERALTFSCYGQALWPANLVLAS
jgi:hypothetical protein